MIRSFTLTVLVAALMVSPAVLAQTNATQAQHASPDAEAPARWPASENLRTTMREVAELLRAAKTAVADDQLASARLDAIADALEERIARISVNDTTSASAKKALALIIGEFGDSVDLMRNSSHLAARRLGYLMAARTADNYGKEFDHADWEALNEK